MAYNILVATDGSKFGNRAVDYGLDMAKKLNADVLALFVINLKHFEIYALEHHDDITGYEDENLRMRGEGEDALNYAVNRAREKGVSLKTRIVRGYPADEIIKTARDEGAALIVVGNLGRTGIERMLLGSVSEAVVRNAPCPVLVVRGE
ncbi:MAG TPA: universal stress protein [Methanocella sp.]|nr:universal stress protein [Methanocella sp.]